MPRKALAPVRAALRFARMATDECGACSTLPTRDRDARREHAEERPRDQRVRQQAL